MYTVYRSVRKATFCIAVCQEDVFESFAERSDGHTRAPFPIRLCRTLHWSYSFLLCKDQYAGFCSHVTICIVCLHHNGDEIGLLVSLPSFLGRLIFILFQALLSY